MHIVLMHLRSQFVIFLYNSVHLGDLHSFPTRRSSDLWASVLEMDSWVDRIQHRPERVLRVVAARENGSPGPRAVPRRSEEHTSELQSRGHLVCRLLLEKTKESSRSSRGTWNSNAQRAS